MGLHDLAKLVFEYMRIDGHLPDSSILEFLVSSFANAGKFDFAKQLLSHAQSDNVELRSFVYNNLLSLLVKQNRVQEAVCLFREHIIRLQFYRADTCTFNIVIRGLCRVGEVEKAIGFFNDMGSFGCLPDVITYNTLINGFCKVGEVHRSLELLREIQSGNRFSPDVVTFTSVISGFCKSGNMELASNIFDEMLRWRDDIVPQPFIYNPVIDGFSKAGNIDEANVIVAEMEAKRCKPDKLTFTILIIGHCMKGKMNEAINIYNKMLAIGCAPDRITVNSLISCLLKAGMPNEAFKIMQTASEDLNLGIASSRRNVPIRTNMDIPVAV
ncbi:Pentatricopeptide repeat-containing protein [Camellia lanceoleosa]|uniref:Pentatricopeptide repeat-containing protein n=1 Tax=Camellia lanceoleosa TaxID=1840588 RepID=A0ACC0IRT3_9ERIC|nr:Pentatricopeptide repeat-containing protein [Camellia lanceoleosa]